MRVLRVLLVLLPICVVLLAARLAPHIWQRANQETSETGELFGTVLAGGAPVAGARVRYKGRGPAVMSDARGHFRLPPPSTNEERVTAWKEGYLIAGQQAAESPLDLHLHRLPKEDCEQYDWVDPIPDPGRSGN